MVMHPYGKILSPPKYLGDVERISKNLQKSRFYEFFDRTHAARELRRGKFWFLSPLLERTIFCVSYHFLHVVDFP